MPISGINPDEISINEDGEVVLCDDFLNEKITLRTVSPSATNRSCDNVSCPGSTNTLTCLNGSCGGSKNQLCNFQPV